MPQHFPPTTAFANHDHNNCCGDVLARADQMAQAEGLRMTPVRRRTLEILAEKHQAIGAYQVLERLANDGFGSQPPVAYRALEFLVENGLAHRIQSLNAFTACMEPGCQHRPAFLICSQCETVAEVPVAAVKAAVKNLGDTHGFQVDQYCVEVVGLCPACQTDPMS